MSVLAGVDIGGSKISAVAIENGGDVVAETRLPISVDQPEEIYRLTEDALEIVAASISAASFDAIGVGIAGIVDNQQGTVTHAVNLSVGSVVLDIGAFLTDRFDTVVNVENDTNASALGAYKAIAAKEDCNNLAYLSVGTGVAAGIVLNGQIYRGSSGIAGEIGHLPVAPDGPVCRCGLRGCYESVASGTAIDRLWPVSDGGYSAPALFAASRTNPAAAKIVETIASYLAHAVYSLVLILDVEIVVLGGGVTEVGSPFVDAVGNGLRALERQSKFVHDLNLRDRIRPSPEYNIGAIGAAVAAAELCKC